MANSMSFTAPTLCSLSTEPSSSRAETEALLEAGEISPLEYLVVHEEALDGELMERDWRRDVWLAKENVRKFATEGK